MWLTKKIPGNAVKRMELLSLDHHEVQCECVNLVTLGARLIHHAGQPEARYEWEEKKDGFHGEPAREFLKQKAGTFNRFSAFAEYRHIWGKGYFCNISKVLNNDKLLIFVSFILPPLLKTKNFHVFLSCQKWWIKMIFF